MLAFGLVAVIGVLFLAVIWWAMTRWTRLQVDHAPDRTATPIFDAGPPLFDVRDWLNGGRIGRSRA